MANRAGERERAGPLRSVTGGWIGWAHSPTKPLENRDGKSRLILNPLRHERCQLIFQTFVVKLTDRRPSVFGVLDQVGDTRKKLRAGVEPGRSSIVRRACCTQLSAKP